MNCSSTDQCLLCWTVAWEAAPKSFSMVRFLLSFGFVVLAPAHAQAQCSLLLCDLPLRRESRSSQLAMPLCPKDPTPR